MIDSILCKKKKKQTSLHQRQEELSLMSMTPVSLNDMCIRKTGGKAMAVACPEAQKKKKVISCYLK